MSEVRNMFITAAVAVLLAPAAAVAVKAPVVEKVEPPCWWTGMACDTLQLMVYGPDIRDCDVSLDYPGVRIDTVVRPDSPDYQFIYLIVGDDACPGHLDLVFSKGKKKTRLAYDLLSRRQGSALRKGFDSSDVLYLIMPDRFAKGSDAAEKGERQLRFRAGFDRNDPNARHGGDIAGMISHLDYLDTLGVTAIWVNPVLTNDMPGGSYHGYATTDYYSVDPRFGSNSDWKAFVDSAHCRGMKVVMDMIFNHCGSEHPWVGDRPFADWFNFADGYVQTNYRLSTVHDPYVSDYDLARTVDGWFVESMPDLNQRNPHLMKYLSQNSIWWIEESGIDGIRMDTHPYADFNAMAGWIRDVRKEYPDFNIVGECWYGQEGGEAFWQRGSYVNRKGDPELPVVMDFVLSIMGRDAFSSQTDRLGGLNRIYDHLALDYLYPDPKNILTFLDNHDTDRFLLEKPEDLGWWKQAMTFLLTSRGIPQIYYGTEALMSGSKEGSDGYVRRDMPGGFPGDSVNVFTDRGRTPLQREAYDFLRRLLEFRKGNRVVAEGSLKHFMPEQGLYVYERRLGHDRFIVVMNGNDSEQTVDMTPTVEIMPFGTQMHDVLGGGYMTIGPKMTFAPRAIYILEDIRL